MTGEDTAKDHEARLGARLRRLYGQEQGTAALPDLLALIEKWRGPVAANMSLRGDAGDREGPGFTQQDAVLIAYGDHLRRHRQRPLVTLGRWCRRHLGGHVSTVHVLPFHPSTSYEGYAITDYSAVDPDLGQWEDLEYLNKTFALMMDVVLNHCSSSHPWFWQFLADKEPGRRYFITVPDPEAAWLGGVFRARDLPLTYSHDTVEGKKNVWATYSPDLVDVNWREPDLALEFLGVMLESVARGARALRLDAFGYVWKAEGTTCVNQPENHELVHLMQDTLVAAGATTTAILPSVTNVTQAENYTYFGAGEETSSRQADLIYHLPLSGLLLHTLYNHDVRALTRWLAELPDAPRGRAYLNLAASHDGVGLTWMEGLVSAEQMGNLVRAAKQRGSLLRTRRRTRGAPERPWELNCTYFSACAADPEEAPGAHADRFLVTQAVVLALRGVPALYLSLLVAGENDHEGVAAASEDAVGQCQNRKINRGRFDVALWEADIADTDSVRFEVYHRMLGLLRARTGHPAFHPDGAQRVLDVGCAAVFAMVRTPPPKHGRGADLQSVLCLSNFAAEPVELPAAPALEAAELANDDVLQDLVSEDCVELDASATRRSFKLAPYQTAWLTRCPDPPHLHCYGLDDPRAEELLALPHSKIVHFIRHGESRHQLRAASEKRRGNTCRCFEDPPVPAEQNRCPYFVPELVDSTLSIKGRLQASAHTVDCPAEVVLVSVMTRSLQTATVAFCSTPTIPPEDKKLIALEQLRAKIGRHMHSRRRDLCEIKPEFPGVDFSQVHHDADVLWTPAGESRLSLDLRATEFLKILLARPEKNIAVVTHFTMLLTLFFPPSDTRVVGRNPSRADDGPPMLDCSLSQDPAGLSGFVQPAQRRALIVVSGEAGN